MKRVVKASKAEDKGLRVINVSLDVVVPAQADGYTIAQAIMDLSNKYYGDGVRVAAADVGGDITSIYEYDYPEEIRI